MTLAIGTKPYLTTRRIAQMLGKTHEEIEIAVESGQLPVLHRAQRGAGRAGLNWRVSRDIALAWLETMGFKRPQPKDTFQHTAKPISSRVTFTTGMVARICEVAPRTASAWIDTGKLKGYRIPGSQDRRVNRGDLIEFMRRYGLPLGELEHDGIVTIGLSNELASAVYANVSPLPSFAVQSWVEAGATIERRKPSTLIVDASLGRGECLASIRALRQDARLAGLRIVALLSEDEEFPAVWTMAGANAVLRSPVSVAEVAAAIGEGRE